MKMPPRDIPQNLTAPEYYELALEYKKMGWIEQARDASLLAIELAPETDTSRAAQLFLKTKVPKYPVPLLAEQRFIDGFNQMAKGEFSDAREIFESLVIDYPDFEWAHGQLSVMCLQEGDNDRARELLTKALAVNPDYVNGWLHLAMVNGLELDFEAARSCVERALQCDPTDQTAMQMKSDLDKLDAE